MHAVRSFVGGLVGALVGSSIWLICESVLDQNLLWLVVLAGIFAGVGIRIAVGPPDRSTVTGLVGAVCTLLGLAVANLGYSQIAAPEAGPNAIAESRAAESQEELDAARAEAEQTRIAEAEAEAARLEAERLAAEQADAPESAESTEGGAEPIDEESAQAGEQDLPVLESTAPMTTSSSPTSSGPKTSSTNWSPTEIAAHAIAMFAAFLLGSIGVTTRAGSASASEESDSETNPEADAS